MQTLQISDQAAQQLQSMAAQEHITSSDLIERLVAKHQQEIQKKKHSPRSINIWVI